MKKYIIQDGRSSFTFKKIKKNKNKKKKETKKEKKQKKAVFNFVKVVTSQDHARPRRQEHIPSSCTT